MKKNFFLLSYQFYTINELLSFFDFQNAITVFPSEFLFLNLQLPIFLLTFCFE